MSLWNKNFWYTKILELATSDTLVKTQLFRFVDVLPVLKTCEQKRDHLIEYLSPPTRATTWPLSLKALVLLLRVPVLSRLIVRLADFQVSQMARNFIIGRNLEETVPKLLKSRDRNLGFTLDILGETVFSDEDSEMYLSLYKDLISGLGDQSKTWARNSLLDESALGSIPSVNISLKISALDCRMDPAGFESSLARLSERIEPLMRLAMQKNVFINFDMEQFSLRSLTRELFRRILSKNEFRSYRHFGIVVQAYQRQSREDVRDWIEFAKWRETSFSIRLVKGAYWDYEVIQASQNSWPSPVYDHKSESDLNYEICSRDLLKAYPAIELALGSHNIRSISQAIAYAEELKLPQNSFEIQMLYGMADPFKDSLVKKGYRVREYDPVGEMLPGLSYLVRRLLENSANDSFLKQSFMDGTEIRQLLKSPKGKNL